MKIGRKISILVRRKNGSSLKRINRHIIPFILCLGMILSVALPASAASVSWSDSAGYYCTMTVTANTSKSDTVIISAMPKQYHTYGKKEYLSYSGRVNVTSYASYSSAGINRTYLLQAMTASGLKSSYTYSGDFTLAAVMNANMPSGYYKIGVVFDGRGGSWVVTKGAITSRTAVEPAGYEPLNGTITYAPTGGIRGYTTEPV